MFFWGGWHAKTFDHQWENGFQNFAIKKTVQNNATLWNTLRSFALLKSENLFAKATFAIYFASLWQKCCVTFGQL